MALTDDDLGGYTSAGMTEGALARDLPTIPPNEVSTDGVLPGTDPAPQHILDPGFELTLRPMRYPQFFDMYRDAIKNTWTVDEIDFTSDINDLERKLSPAERHLCLLYTSPSPRDQRGSRMPSSA